MKLDKFLSETLLGIARGVRSANDQLGKKQYVIYNTNDNVIEFDVAIIAQEGSAAVVEGEAGSGIPGLVAKIRGNISNSKSDKNVSRLKFRVNPRMQID